MAAGAAVLVILATFRGSFAPVEAFGPPQWLGALSRSFRQRDDLLPVGLRAGGGAKTTSGGIAAIWD
jgi:hypothetical protein